MTAATPAAPVLGRVNLQPEPILAYHGSGIRLERFDAAAANPETMSGFSFTTDLEQALQDCEAAPHGLPAREGEACMPTVHVVALQVRALLDAQARQPLTDAQLRAWLERSPALDTALLPWGLAVDGRERAIARAIADYRHRAGEAPLLHTLQRLAEGFFPNHRQTFNAAFRDILQCDGIVHYAAAEDTAHYGVLFPEQIEILDRIPAEQVAAQLQYEAQAMRAARRTRAPQAI